MLNDAHGHHFDAPAGGFGQRPGPGYLAHLGLHLGVALPSRALPVYAAGQS